MLFNRLRNKKDLGAEKEREAKAFLKQQGLKFIAQNFHCKWGEIDLIFSQPETNTIIFVEVRYRSSAKYGGAAQSVTPEKQNKIKKSAIFYLSQRKLEPNIRFDVIAFEQQQLNWLQSAF